MAEAQEMDRLKSGITREDVEHRMFQIEQWAEMTPVLVALCAGLVVLGVAACMLLSARGRTPAVRRVPGVAVRCPRFRSESQ